MIELPHARVALALHCLRHGEGRPTLLLHALGGSSSDWELAAFDGAAPIYALDFSGHGRSGRLYGGAYYPELWAADADVALAHLAKPALVVGAGVGAYVALLLAGARPERVDAAVLLPGAGLDGGGALPDFDRFDMPPPAREVARGIASSPGVDPAVVFSESDQRPTDYAIRFAELARRVLLVEDGQARPPWWEAIRALDGVESQPDLAAGWISC